MRKPPEDSRESGYDWMTLLVAIAWVTPALWAPHHFSS